MKKSLSRARWIYIWKTISSNKIPFIVLFIFPCLALLLYTGISWSGQSMERSMYGYCESGKMFDISLTSPIGFTESGIERLLAVDGVDEAEGVRLTYGFFESHDRHFTAKVLSASERISVSSVVCGTLPKNADELAIEGKWARQNGISVGDVISIDKECDELNESTFTVTALVENPVCVYTGTNEKMVGTCVPVETFIFAPSAAFKSTPAKIYEQVYLRSNSLRQFELESEEYTSAVKSLKEKVSETATDEVKKSFEMLMGFDESLEKADAKSAACIVQTPDETESFSVLHILLELSGRIKYSVSLPFILVCLAISCAVVLRLTSEDANVIGLQLAMGATNARITLTYLMFSVIPIVIGSVLGTVLGCVIGEPLIVGLVSQAWVIDERIPVFHFGEALFLIASITALMILVAIVSCRFVLKRNTLSLINGADVPSLKAAFYEKSRLWNRLSLPTKSIVNNIRTDHMRVAITLVSIVGCTALLVEGLYVIHSVKASFVRQFEAVQGYETVVYFDGEPDAETQIAEKLSENGIASLSVYSESGFLSAPDGKTILASVIVTDKDLDGWLNLHSAENEKLRQLDGALLSLPYAGYYDISASEAVAYTDSEGNKYDVNCTGVFEYHLDYQLLLFSHEDYAALTGKSVKNNTVLLANNDLSISAIDTLLHDVDGYYSTFDYKAHAYSGYILIQSMVTGISAISLVLSLSMALFMQLNLFVQFVTEKKREMITMMINGYSISYVRRYIYLDTIFLGVIGALFGAVLGNLLGAMEIEVLRSASSYYSQSVDVIACLEGMAISAAFTALMCLRALRQIKKFGIGDLNKA